MKATTKNTITRIATVLMALQFLASGGIKLTASVYVVVQFAVWGFPEWFPMAIGALEVAGAIGLFIPKLRTLAIYGLITLMVGAIYIHVAKEGSPENSIGAIISIFLGIVILKLRKEASKLSL